MKTHLFNLLVLLLTAFSYGQGSSEIRFLWKTAESNGQVFEKAAILIPVKFDSDTTSYYLQFDTGATYSVLYSNRLKWFNSDQQLLNTTIGEIKFRDNKLIKATDDKNSPVGTLGADFLQGKVVRINFVDQTIIVGGAYDLSDYVVKPLLSLNGRPVIELNIHGSEQKLLYDTGSSLFGIWTSKRNWEQLRKGPGQVSSFPISSWGEMNTGYYSSLEKAIPPVWRGGEVDKDLQIWYVDNRKFRRFFRKNGLFGILGNQPLLNKEIVMDYTKGWIGIKIVGNNL